MQLPAIIGIISLLFGFAFIARAVSLKLNIVPYVGVLLVGILISFLLNLTHTHIPHEFEEFIHNLSESGVWAILFLAGLELNLNKIRATGTASLKVAVMGMIGPVLFGTIFASMFFGNNNILQSVYFGVIFSATSVGVPLVVAASIKKKNTIRESAMVTLTGAGIADDILSIILYTVVLAFATGANIQTTALIGSNLAVVAYILVSLFADTTIGNLISKFHIDEQGEKLLLCIVVFGLNIGFCSILGISPVVGAFCAGLQLDEAHFFSGNGDKTKHKIQNAQEIVETIAFPAITIFFINAGLQFKWDVITPQAIILGVMSFVFVGFAGKFVMTQLALRNGEQRVVGLGMAHFAEVALVVASAGLINKVITEEIFAIAMVGIISSLLIMPYFFSKAVKATTDNV